MERATDTKTNVRIRKAMLDANISQGDLAAILNVAQPEVCHFMKWELAQREQDYIISKIRGAQV